MGLSVTTKANGEENKARWVPRYFVLCTINVIHSPHDNFEGKPHTGK